MCTVGQSEDGDIDKHFESVSSQGRCMRESESPVCVAHMVEAKESRDNQRPEA